MAESGEVVKIVSNGPSPEARPRRRCVQSKLPWLVDGGRATVVAVEDGGREGLEESGSGSEEKPKKRRKSQAKATRESQASGNEATGWNAGNINSLVLSSKKSSRQLKKKKDGDTTPGLIRGSSEFDADQQNHTQPVFDLWLEAKIAAEENGRLSAGKQTHPFFTCKKSIRKAPDSRHYTKPGSRHCSGLDDVYGPVHIFDKSQDDAISLDWKNWIFTEDGLHDLNSIWAEKNLPSAFEGSVGPLKVDTVCNKMSFLCQLSDEGKTQSVKSATSLAADEQLFEKSISVHADDNNSLLSRCSRCMITTDNELKDCFLKQSHWSEYCLWTNKYQPLYASEVCGNSKSIRFLSEWLKSWHEREKKGNMKLNCSDSTADDSQGSFYQSESEMDDADDAASLDNVLLITGPVGTGKSAAIYACAKEQKFEVIEVNASDLRNGALVKLKFGEAMESHRFKTWSGDDPIGPRRKDILERTPGPPSNNGDEEVMNGPIETDSGCEHGIWHEGCFLNGTESRDTPFGGANKSLILFEDVDTVFEEDRGFISTILQLAETAKRPIILTSNKKNPKLPHPLDRLVLNFTFPSSGELLSHLEMVCGAEKTHVSSFLLKQLISSCLGDIRKILMILQFWCQGNRSQIERNMLCTYSPLPFDIDAAHLVIPRVISWDFPCQLSEMVEEEVNSAIFKVEENLQLKEIVTQQEIASRDVIHSSKLGNNVVDNGKKDILKRNGFLLATKDEMNEGPFAASTSPLKFARRRVKHRPGMVVSSSSDDESCANLPEDSISPDSNGCTTSPVSAVCFLQTRGVQHHLELPSTTIHEFKRDNPVGNPLESSEAASPSHICDTLKMELSCVPESSFAPGSETNKDDCQSIPASPDQLSLSFADFIRSFHDLPNADANDLDKTMVESNQLSETNGENSCDIDVESVHGNEELRNVQSEHEPLAREYLLMDECSQADSTCRLFHGKNHNCSLEVDPVQETWRKLRSQRGDLKSYIAMNQKDALLAVNYASALTDLISEMDIMRSGCEAFSTDNMEPSMTPCVEPDSLSWHDEQFEMGSTFAQHGLCFYANKCATMAASLGQGTVDLTQEMLGSSTNTMALGKLLVCHNSYAEKVTRGKSSTCGISFDRELVSELHNAMFSIVPLRSSMLLRGPAFSDYLSSMSQISKLESQRLSEGSKGSKRTRRRRSKSLFSSEQLELFARSFRFKVGVL